MQPPIIVSDNGDVLFFKTVALAERYIEPWLLEELAAYDSQGRKLNVKPNGFITSFETLEAEPNHSRELEELVSSYLLKVAGRFELSKDWIRRASLSELIEIGITKCETK